VAVDDLWYPARKSTSGQRVKSKLHGRGKRYRVRYVDAAGKNATKFYDKKKEADDFDLKARSGTAPEVKLDQTEKRVTFGEYAERWRVSRAIGQSLEYQDHVLSRLRTHHLPRFGHRPIRAITVTDVMEWLASLLNAGAAQSSISTLFNNLNTIMNAAVADKVIADNPCKAVPIHSILRGVSRAPKWVPTDEQVLDLLDVVPPKFLAAIWLGAGQGMRLGEVLGMEAGTRCVDYLAREVHVVQQLRFNNKEYSGFYLAPPKSRSAGTVDLDDQVGIMLAEHLRKFPPVTVSLPDITTGTPDPGKPATRRDAELLFTTDDRKPYRRPALVGHVPGMAHRGRVAARGFVPQPSALLRDHTDRERHRPDRRAEGATAPNPADHVGDVRALVAQERPAPQHRQRGTGHQALATRTAGGLNLICRGIVVAALPRGVLPGQGRSRWRLYVVTRTARTYARRTAAD
jgi:hypothetical protein